MSNDRLLTDLPALVAGGFAPARGVGEGWIPVAWETADRKGVGLAAGAGSGAPELAIELGLTGWQTLHFAVGSRTALRVRVDGEPGDREFVTQHGGIGLQECRYHAADLTGRRVHIGLSGAAGAFLGYIRAEPSAGPLRGARNLIATNDGETPFGFGGLASIDDVGRYFSPFRDSDFFRILFGPSGADVTACHPTRVGTLLPQTPTHSFGVGGPGGRAQAALMARVAKEPGFNILAAAVDGAHEAGLEIHFYIRMEAFLGPFPLDPSYTSRFYIEHPEWRCRDEHGEEIARMSYAFPGVQDHMLDYFQELLGYRPDGLCLSFNRGLPMMIAEEPVLAEFERREGRRPRLPEEIDSEGMIAARTALMSGFFARVKALLDARGLALSCIVHPDDAFNRACGLDLESLAERGVFESICVHSGGHHAPAVQVHQSPFWKKLRDSKRVPIYPYGWGGSYDHADSARFLRDSIFGQQFTGGFFWDTENFFMNPYNWHVIRQGGTAELLEGVITGQIPSPKIAPLTRIRGVKLGRYNPMASY